MESNLPKLSRLKVAALKFRSENMQDLLFISATIIFFAVSLGYVHFCDRMK